MNIDIFAKYIPNFLLILLRAGIIVSLLPFLGSGNFPAQMKIGLAVVIAFILTPIVELHVTEKGIPLLVLNEIILGIAFGYTARFVFFAVEIAGQVISNSMGMTIAHVFNPEIGPSTELAQFFVYIGMLIFLAMDAHHDLIYILVKSYEWLPAGEITASKMVPAVISLGSAMFIIALKISAPVIIIMLISHILLGFVYKAAPQINIFFVAYPIYIFVGLFVMLIGLPVFMNVMGGYLNTIKDELTKIMAIARG